MKIAFIFNIFIFVNLLFACGLSRATVRQYPTMFANNTDSIDDSTGRGQWLLSTFGQSSAALVYLAKTSGDTAIITLRVPEEVLKILVEGDAAFESLQNANPQASEEQIELAMRAVQMGLVQKSLANGSSWIAL